MATVMQSLSEEDAARPNDYWKKSALDETTVSHARLGCVV